MNRIESKHVKSPKDLKGEGYRQTAKFESDRFPVPQLPPSRPYSSNCQMADPGERLNHTNEVKLLREINLEHGQVLPKKIEVYQLSDFILDHFPYLQKGYFPINHPEYLQEVPPDVKRILSLNKYI